jgi:hypothetical protein
VTVWTGTLGDTCWVLAISPRISIAFLEHAAAIESTMIQVLAV